MRKTILAILVLLLVAAPAYAKYNIHLKNGSVIRGVSSYQEVDGELRFKYMGGTLGIPLDDVLKVEEVGRPGSAMSPDSEDEGIVERRKPVVPPYQLVPGPSQPNTAPEKKRLAQINSRLAYIDSQEAKRDEVKVEYDRVRLRIEVLFQKGLAEAKRRGGDPAQWFRFLPAQEREWAQLNTLKKNKLKKDLEEMDKALAPLLEEKAVLLQEKADLEQQIREAESPF